MDSMWQYGIFKTVELKCPQSQTYQAFAITERKKDHLITFGYIRSKWRKCRMQNHLFPPEYLIRIICGYYWNEWVHLFGRDDGAHYEIEVFELLDFKC